MNALTAHDGWRWLTDGFALFRKRPGRLTMLFFSYLFIMIGLGIIPVVGQLLPLLLAPTFSAVFMTACAQITRDGRLNPLQLRLMFAPPSATRLVALGVIYLLGAVLAIGLSSLIDDGLFVKLMMGQRDLQPTGEQGAKVLLTLLVLAAAVIPPFWYAPPLILWQKMSVGKAIFYSFFAVIRSIKAFFIYFLGWIVVGALLPSLLMGLLAMAIGKTPAMLLMFTLTIVLTVVMYCSFYPTYISVFGEPDLPDTESPVLPDTEASDLP